MSEFKKMCLEYADQWTESMNNWIEDLAFGIKHNMDEDYKNRCASNITDRMKWAIDNIYEGVKDE